MSLGEKPHPSLQINSFRPAAASLPGMQARHSDACFFFKAS